MGYLLLARLSFPVTTNSVPWIFLTSHSADGAALHFSSSFPPDSRSCSLLHYPTEVLLDTQTCHDGRQINTCMLKPIRERGTLRLAECWGWLRGWKVWGVYSHWRGNDKSLDDEWVLLLLTFHKKFPPSRHFTALSCRQQQPPCTTA